MPPVPGIRPTQKKLTARRKAEQKRLADAEHQKQAKKRRNRRLLMEAQTEAAEFAPAPKKNVDPAQAVQEILDNIIAMYRYSTAQVATLDERDYWRDTIAGRVQNEWIREQERLGMQAVHVASKAAAMGLAERAVAIQEAQAAMFAMVVEQVLTEFKMSSDQRRKIHTRIAERLEDIELEPVALERVA